MAILGGAKVSDKIGVINNLLEKADTITVSYTHLYLHEDFRLFHLSSALAEDTAFHYHEFHKLVFLSLIHISSPGKSRRSGHMALRPRARRRQTPRASESAHTAPA